FQEFERDLATLVRFNLWQPRQQRMDQKPATKALRILWRRRRRFLSVICVRWPDKARRGEFHQRFFAGPWMQRCFLAGFGIFQRPPQLNVVAERENGLVSAHALRADVLC